jgi:uncharacterized protein (TIGR02722 family)
MKRILVLAALAVAVLALAAGCGKRTQVTRVDSDTTIDLSGNWNDTDSRLVSEALVADCMNGPWIRSHLMAEQANPVVIVGSIRNRTNDHIATAVFVKDLERSFINSGQVDVVASADERTELRDERLDQLANADPETIKQMGRELGADYMMIGTISTQADQADNTKVLFYQVDMELVHLETNKKAWIGSHEIKKVRQQGRYKG